MRICIPGFKPVDDGQDTPATPVVATAPAPLSTVAPELIPVVQPKPLVDNPPAAPELMGIAGTNISTAAGAAALATAAPVPAGTFPNDVGEHAPAPSSEDQAIQDEAAATLAQIEAEEAELAKHEAATNRVAQLKAKLAEIQTHKPHDTEHKA